MLHAHSVAPKGSWSARPRAGITLAYEERYRRRLRLTADDGTDFLLDLPETTLLREGDGLRLDDGSIVLVRAAPEDVVEVTGSAADLIRFAWHLGNRHLPADLTPDRILIRDDDVIVDLLLRLGAEVRKVRAPFNPERGAYSGIAAGHAHGHDSHHHSHSDHRHE